MGEEELLELRGWVDAVERVIAERPCRFVKRVVAVAETASTQDAGAAMCAGEGGLLVLAGRQVAGRGRLGRVWTQREGMGVAATLAVEATREEQAVVALGAGVAAAMAVEKVLAAGAGAGQVGIRWPNDVVERRGGRKIAGVLIEARGSDAGGLLLVGIGINVLQGESDWPPELRGRAVSLHALGSAADRRDVIVALVESLERSLADALGDDAARRELLARWRERDVLTGTRAAFIVGNERVEGVVESVEPSLEVTVRTDSGKLVLLPAMTASLAP